MIVLLRILGILTIIGGFFVGATINKALRIQEGIPPSAPVLFFLLYVGIGFTASLIWFALAQILRNQAEASVEREELYRMLRRQNDAAGI